MIPPNPSRTGVSEGIVKAAFQNFELRLAEFRKPNGFRGISLVRVPDRNQVSNRLQEDRFQVIDRADRQIEGKSCFFRSHAKKDNERE